MAKNKTAQTSNSVTDFINKVDDETKRDDSFHIIELMTSQTGFEPAMWGTSIVGFGTYHYRYDTGREGDAPLVGFSPRKSAIVLYFAADFNKKDALLKKLGKHTTGVGCVYLKKLADVDVEVLKEMIKNSVAALKKLYPS